MIKWVVIALACLFAIAWFSNTHLLLKFFPYSNGAEFYTFMEALIPTYEGMCLILIIALYLTSKGLIKAMWFFMMIIVLASVIDKAVFKITTYIYSDIVLVVIALIVSAIVYGRNK